MNCESTQDLIISKLGGEIETAEELELKNHLEACDDCKKIDLEFRAVSGLIQQLPRREWDERLRIKDLLRRDQRWKTMLLSKAALWVVLLTAAITAVSFLPLSWEVSATSFSVRWGSGSGQPENLAEQLRSVQTQLTVIQQQNQEFQRVSELRIREIVEQDNAGQQKQYLQTLELFDNYLQLQRSADIQKIQHEIASTYDRTGQEMERTNELLENVIRVSGSGSLYGSD